MSYFKNIAIVTAFLLPLAFAAAAPASAGEGTHTFEIAGTVKGVWCLLGPEPPVQPCYLEIEVELGSDATTVGVWCKGAIAEICEPLHSGLKVIVLGEDNGTEKVATHIALWLEPGEEQSDS